MSSLRARISGHGRSGSVLSHTMTSSQARQRQRQRLAPAVHAVVEQMESRRLLAVTLSAGTLNITGDATNESYTFSLTATNVTVKRNNVAAGTFALTAVTKVLANLGAGN